MPTILDTLADIRREAARMKQERAARKHEPPPERVVMTGYDIGLCLEAADAVDVFRGVRWFDTFLDVAYGLGYRLDTTFVCHHGVKPDNACPHAACGLFKPK